MFPSLHSGHSTGAPPTLALAGTGCSSLTSAKFFPRPGSLSTNTVLVLAPDYSRLSLLVSLLRTMLPHDTWWRLIGDTLVLGQRGGEGRGVGLPESPPSAPQVRRASPVPSLEGHLLSECVWTSWCSLWNLSPVPLTIS